MPTDKTSIGQLFVELLLKDQGFKQGLGDAEKQVKSSGKVMTDLAKTVRNTVSTAFKVATVSIAAFGTASLVVGAGFQQQMAIVSAISGKVGDDLIPLVEQARKLGATTEFTATQAGEALESLVRAGLSSAEAINASSAALLLAGTSGAELKGSADLLAATMRQFGLDADESTRIMDVFSTAMRSSLLDFESIREAMKFAGTAGAAFGMTLEETTAAIAAFRDLGLEGSLAGTQFRMAMIAAAKGTDQQAAALKKYGLVLGDINPETNTFNEIMAKMAKAGITASDSIAIFGARAGANIAQLAAQIKTGELDLFAFTDKLQNAAGTTAEMYETIGQTVTFAGKVARSALEDLLIQTFETFAGPLQTLLEQIPLLLNTLSSNLKAESGTIQAIFKDTFGRLTDFLRENAEELGQTFVTIVRLSAQAASAMEPLLELFLILLSKAEELSVILPAAFAIATLVKLIPVVTGIASAFGLADIAVVAFGTTLTVTTGGLFAIVAAIGVIVVALGTYISVIARAKQETELLRAAQARLSEESEAVAKAEEDRLGPILEAQKERVRELLETTDDLTSGERRRLESVLALTAESARLLLNEGKLVESGGELISTQDLIAKHGADATLVIRSQADALDESVKSMDKQIAVIEKSVGIFREQDNAITKLIALNKIRNQLDNQEIATLEEGLALLAQLKAKRQEEAQRATNLRDEAAKGRASSLIEQRKMELEADRERARSITFSTEGEITAARKAAEAIIAIEEGLLDDRLKLLDDDIEQAVIALKRKQAEVNKAFDTLIDSEKAAGARLIEIERRRAAVLKQVQDNFVAEAEAGARETADELAMIRQEAEEKAQEIIERIQIRGISRSKQLELQKAKILEELTLASASSRATISADFDKQIAEARKAELEDAEKDTDNFLGKLVSAFKGAGEAMGQAFNQVGQALKDVGNAVFDVVSEITGLDFSLAGLFDVVKQAIGATEEARKAAGEAAAGEAEAAGASPEEIAAAVGAAMAAFDPVENAVAFIDELIANAGNFINAIIESLPAILQSIADNLPVLIQKVVDAIPEVVQAFVDNFPLIVDAIVDGLPKIMKAIGEDLPDLIDVIIDSIPKIVDAFIEELPRITQALLDSIPDLVGAIVDAIVSIIELTPVLIDQLLKAIPDILTALGDGVVLIVEALVDALPALITSIIDSIPKIIKGLVDAIADIIVALVDSIPVIIAALIDAIPDLIVAVLEAVTEIITTVLELIPDIILSLIDSLPMLIDSLVGLLPELFFAITKAIPGIIGSLVSTLVDLTITALPDIVIAVVTTLFELISKGIPRMVEDFVHEFRDFISEIGKAIGDAILDVINVFKKKDEKDKGGGGPGVDPIEQAAKDARAAMEAAANAAALEAGMALTGIANVPATMRVTVHKGEAIIPAHRNAAAGGVNPAQAGRTEQAGGSGGGGGMRIEIPIFAEGALVDRLVITATERGTATGVADAIRKASDAEIGFDRGRFRSFVPA